MNPKDPQFVSHLEQREDVRTNSGSSQPSSAPRVLLVGTMDTKAEEMTVLANEIGRVGGIPIVLDSGIGSAPEIGELTIDIGQQEVAMASGKDLADVWSTPRGEAVEMMRSGITSIVRQLHEGRQIDGAICIGGAGAHLAGPAFQALPLAVPKLIVSPLASGNRQFEPYVGTSNVAVMHSVVDIAGHNEISESIYRQAAGYIVGAASAMISGASLTRSGTRPLIAVSMNGNTTPVVNQIRHQLEVSGFDVVAFHANGVGGRAMEELVKAGEFIAVVDITTTELAGAQYGGLMDPGPDRMEVAGRAGIPQVLVPGCLDFITTGRYDEAIREFPDHILFAHNPELTLVRMSAAQMDNLGRVFARKANTALGPTTICVPSEGLSIPGAVGGPFSDPQADGAFLRALEAELSETIPVRVVNAHINDPEFGVAVLEELSAVQAAATSTKKESRSTMEPTSEHR